jgi:hypothetical protein
MSDPNKLISIVPSLEIPLTNIFELLIIAGTPNRYSYFESFVALIFPTNSISTEYKLVSGLYTGKFFILYSIFSSLS